MTSYEKQLENHNEKLQEKLNDLEDEYNKFRAQFSGQICKIVVEVEYTKLRYGRRRVFMEAEACCSRPAYDIIYACQDKSKKFIDHFLIPSNDNDNNNISEVFALGREAVEEKLSNGAEEAEHSGATFISGQEDGENKKVRIITTYYMLGDSKDDGRYEIR